MTQTVKFQSNPVTVAGKIPQKGDVAKPFTLVAKDLSDVSILLDVIDCGCWSCSLFCEMRGC